MGTKLAQRIHQHADGTMLHPIGTRYHMGTTHHAEVGRHKAHGCTCRLDVDNLRHISDGIDNHFRVVTVAQVLRQLISAAEGIDNQSTI